MIFTDEEPEERADDWKELIHSLDDHYNFVLRLFDEGIAALEKAEAEEVDVPTSIPSPPVTATFSPHTPCATLKRSCEEDAGPQRPLKRPKTPRPVRIRGNLSFPPDLCSR
jgi:hypothetical protein